MATVADITIKKADGTTNIVWTAKAGAGGDASPAVWRSDTSIGTLGQRPTFSIMTKWNGPKTARRVEITGAFPSVYTNSSTGQTEVRGVIPLVASFAVPMNLSTTDLNEAAAQMCNLLASSQVVSAIASGYAPT